MMRLNNEALVEQVKYWGLFNPNWQKDSNEPFAEAEMNWGNCSVDKEDMQRQISLHADDWVKVMEASMLRYFDEPIPIVEALRHELVSLPQEILESVVINAQARFAAKHPGFIENDLRYRLTTTALLACWMEETWYSDYLKTPTLLNKINITQWGTGGNFSTT